ncbi:hypothetical protein [Paenibacillus donghaensis]|nr:hypothetical protein [Paenibacillus donghaensis]
MVEGTLENEAVQAAAAAPNNTSAAVQGIMAKLDAVSDANKNVAQVVTT